jgi:hypothetical protein
VLRTLWAATDIRQIRRLKAAATKSHRKTQQQVPHRIREERGWIRDDNVKAKSRGKLPGLPAGRQVEILWNSKTGTLWMG